MTGGYFEFAAATTNGGDSVGFGYQASVYPDSATASRAFWDGQRHQAQYDAGLGCGGSINMACWLFILTSPDGTITSSYIGFQTGRCFGEVSVAANSDIYSANQDTISTTTALIVTVGAKTIRSVCPGAPNSSPSTTSQPASHPAGQNPPKGGSCYSFRGDFWTINQNISTVQDTFWTDLQGDYLNNYPPSSGGSVPGVTQDMFSAARSDMNLIHLQVYDAATHTGLEWDAAQAAVKYGINAKVTTGPFNWAAFKVFSAAYWLDQAAYEEWLQPGAGLSDYHEAQQNLSNAWDALKQLPCYPTPPQSQSAPKTTTTVQQPRLAGILLGLSDLASGYRLNEQHTVSYGNMSQHWGNFETPAKMHRYGWQASYDVNFQRSVPFRTVSEEVSVFSSESGAASFYLDMATQDRRSAGFEMGTQLVGKTAYHYHLSASFGTSATIVFRRGRYVVELTIEPASSYDALVQLCRYVDHNIQTRGWHAPAPRINRQEPERGTEHLRSELLRHSPEPTHPPRSA